MAVQRPNAHVLTHGQSSEWEWHLVGKSNAATGDCVRAGARVWLTIHPNLASVGADLA